MVRVECCAALVVALAIPAVQAQCAAGAVKPTYRYNAETGRLYLEAPQNVTSEPCTTPTEIWEAFPGTVDTLRPIYPIDPATNARVNSPTGTWLLTEDLYIQGGTRLLLHGAGYPWGSGDCEQLRLLSDSSKFINFRVYGGSAHVHSCDITSWDEGSNGPDTNVDDGRSYISIISQVYDPAIVETCEGASTPDKHVGESRMDIMHSDIGYLGYYASESYGLSYKVRGFCTDLSNPQVFDRVQVWGDIQYSKLHNLYFGLYTYGHQDGVWIYNDVYDNYQYGFDPHDDSDNLLIAHNRVWGNVNHGIIASKRCNDVTIMNNTVSDNLNAGIMLHRSSNNARVIQNTITNSGDACIAIFESFSGWYANNVCTGNYYGFRWSVGASWNNVRNNVISQSTQYGIYMYQGSDPPEASADGMNRYNTIMGNTIDGATEAIKMGDSPDNKIIGNTFSNAPQFRFTNCDGLLWQDNVVNDAAAEYAVEGTCFAAGSDLVEGAVLC